MTKTKEIIYLFILLSLCSGINNYTLGEETNMKQQRPNRLGEVHFIPQQNLIVATCSSEPNGSIRFWSIGDGKLKELLDLGKGEWASSLSVSNNGSLIAAALLSKNEIACYSLKEKKWLWKVSWLGKAVVGNTLQFTPDDRKIVVVGFRDIVTYDAQTGAIVRKEEDSKGFSGGFPEYRTRINSISSSARYAVFWQGNLEHDEGRGSSKNIWVLVRDIESGKTIAKQGKIQEKYKNCSAEFTPDEKNLVLGSMDGYVRIWSLASQGMIREWKAYSLDESVPFERDPSPNAIQALTFSSQGRLLATMGNLKGRFAIRLWDYTTNKLSHEFDDVISSSLPMCSGYPMTFSLNGKYFALEQQGNLCLYETETWQEKWCVPSIKGQD